jgi:hypothetical protein
MKNKIIILTIILGCLYGCITPKYYVMKYSQIQSLDLDKSLINYIPLEDELVAKSAILDSSYSLLINKKYISLERYVRNLENSGVNSSDLNMAIVLSEITEQHYFKALIRLDMITTINIHYLKIC